MKREDIKKVLIIGSGPIVIGQACEFDYSGTQACKALRELGYKIVLVNSNPATIMTDPVMADATYIEPLNVERLSQIIEKERPDALLPNLGGQTGLNMAMELNKTGVLDKYGVQVIGVNLDAIERGEDREIFYVLGVPHFVGRATIGSAVAPLLRNGYAIFRIPNARKCVCTIISNYVNDTKWRIPNVFLPKTFSVNTKTFTA